MEEAGEMEGQKLGGTPVLLGASGIMTSSPVPGSHFARQPSRLRKIEPVLEAATSYFDSPEL